MGGHIEHVFAYAATAVIVALGYNELGLSRIITLLLTNAALLEYLQRYTGRHSQLADFLFSSTGIFVGVVAFVLAEFLINVGRRPLARAIASPTWQDRPRWRNRRTVVDRRSSVTATLRTKR